MAEKTESQAMGDAPAGVTITTPLPTAAVWAPYSVALAASGGKQPYSWQLVSGALPPGLSCSPSGVIAGTPQAGGSSTFSIGIVDSSHRKSQASMRIDVAAPGTWADLYENNSLFGNILLARVGGTYVLTSANQANDPQTWTSTDYRTWKPATGATPGVKLQNPWMVSGGGKIWLAGAGTYDMKGYVFAFDPATSAWTKVTDSAPSIRAGLAWWNSAGAWFNGALWVLGGWLPGAASNAVWSSVDGATWVRQPTPPWSARMAAGVTVFDGKLWICGGLTAVPSGNQWITANDIWYTSDGLNWTQGAAVPWDASGNAAGATLAATATRLYAIMASGESSGMTSLAMWQMTEAGTWLPGSAATGLGQVNLFPLSCVADGEKLICASGTDAKISLYTPNSG